MTLVKLGIVKSGKMYIQSESIPTGNFQKRIVKYSPMITDAQLYKEKYADELAIKYGGRVIRITLNIPEADA